MTTAIYHQPAHLRDIELFVVDEKNGKLDLADKDGNLVVSACPVSQDETPGTCSVVVEGKEEGLEGNTIKELRIIAEEAGVQHSGLNKADLIAAIEAAKL